MELQAYLDRIGFTGAPTISRSTLNALMRSQLQSIPFENLNQQLRRPVSTDVSVIYSKLVEQHRGGWCFELNGLFAWVLAEIGFDVQTLAGHVGDDGSGRAKPADHMFLLVNCEEPLLVDVGFGGSMIEALPMREHTVRQAPYTLSIAEEDDGFLRFTEQADKGRTSFDFRLTPVGGGYFDEISMSLQTDKDSSFRRTLTAQRRFENKHLVLRGRLLSTISPGRRHEALLQTSDELVSCLSNEFGLDVPEIGDVWPRIMQRHSQMFGSADVGVRD
ncbi:MAG: arylamine N-acetyltransferase family protein [Geminicoccaceae bacterium]